MWSKRRRKGLKDLTKPPTVPTNTASAAAANVDIQHAATAAPVAAAPDWIQSYRVKHRPSEDVGADRRVPAAKSSSSSSHNAGIATSSNTLVGEGSAGRNVCFTGSPAGGSTTVELQQQQQQQELQYRMSELSSSTDLTALLDVLSTFVGTHQLQQQSHQSS